MIKEDDGFTFAETLAVLAIMLIFTAGVGVSISKYVEKARVLSAKTQIEVYKLAVQSYFIDCGVYPTTEQGLTSLWQVPYIHPIPKNWDGPYVDKEITDDPWGNPYIYTKTTQSLFPFSIKSFGADGTEGGGGKNEDIVSWK